MKHRRAVRWSIPAVLILSLLAVLALAAYKSADPLDTLRAATEKEALQLANRAFQNHQESAEIADSLTASGRSVLIRQEGSPAYLTNPNAVYSFWENVRAGKESILRYVTVHSAGGLSLTVLQYRKDVGTFLSVSTSWENNVSPSVSSWEAHTVQDWELTEGGNFYFRIRPAGDKHYVDYCQLRLTPPDPELTALTNRYIAPVGYYAVNLFLCDWDSQNPGSLSPNDLLEYVYRIRCREDFVYENYPHIEGKSTYMIPAEIFEASLLPYLDISSETLRSQCAYDARRNAYPWTPFVTEDIDSFWFPYVDAEVIHARNNMDGTMTLTVNVSSADLKTDTVFVHEVTIRPGEGNTFQYLSNRILTRTEYGIPPSTPRLTLREFSDQ